MSLNYFQLLDNEPIDNSIPKRDFLKVYHQQRVQLNHSDHTFDFIFGGKNNYYQIVNGFLDFDITVRENDNKKFSL